MWLRMLRGPRDRNAFFLHVQKKDLEQEKPTENHRSSYLDANRYMGEDETSLFCTGLRVGSRSCSRTNSRKEIDKEREKVVGRKREGDSQRK